MEKVERIEEKVESSAANVEAIHRKVEQIAGKEESTEYISRVDGESRKFRGKCRSYS